MAHFYTQTEFLWLKFNAALAILWREFGVLWRKYADFRRNQEPCIGRPSVRMVTFWTASVERYVFLAVKYRTMAHSLTQEIALLLARALARLFTQLLACSLTHLLASKRAHHPTHPLTRSRTRLPTRYLDCPHSCAYLLTHSLPLSLLPSSLPPPPLPPSAMSPRP